MIGAIILLQLEHREEMQMKTSEFKGFYKLPPEQRQQEVAEFCDLTAEDMALLKDTGAISMEAADHMIENVIGVMPMPMGVAVNFTINGRDYLIPMAVEEPSVVAAASNAARHCGFPADRCRPPASADPRQIPGRHWPAR